MNALVVCALTNVYVDIDAFGSSNGDAVIGRFRKKPADVPRSADSDRMVDPRKAGRVWDDVPWIAILDADGNKIADSDSQVVAIRRGWREPIVV